MRALVDRAFLELANAPIETAVEVFVDSLFSLHADRPSLHRTLHHEFPLRFGLQPFIDSDRYIEAKLVSWLVLRMPEVDPAELSTRAFVAIRASRSVTIHAFAEGLCDDRKSRVRAAVKDLLLRTLDAPKLT